MGSAGKGAKLRAGCRTIGRLGKTLVAKRQGLIGAEDQPAGMQSCDRRTPFAARAVQQSQLAPATPRRLRGRAHQYPPGATRPECPPPQAASGARRFSRQAPADREASHSGIAHEARCRRRSPRSARTAAAVSSIERRVTSISGQLCLAHSRREAAISSATACWSIYLSSSRCALRPSSRFCRICTIRSGVAYRPTTSGRLSCSMTGRQRHARNQRNVCRLHAAICQIDRGRRLRGSRDPDQQQRRPLPDRRSAGRRHAASCS